MLSLALSLLLLCASAAPITNIRIDGNFDDWNSVAKRFDPFRPTINDPVVFDGVPATPDVHDTDSTDNQCFVRTEVFNPHADLVEFALAHDTDHVYAYFRAVGEVGKTQPFSNGRFYIQINLDMDNNQGTGYCVGTGGYFPSVCGIDMAFEIEFYNGTFNTEHFLLHAAKDEAEKILDMNDQKQGKKMLEFLNNLIGGKGVVRLADSVIGYKPYTEWVYWLPNDPPTADQAARCAENYENRTSGPFRLPDGAHICFVSDMCKGPFPGSSKYAKSADGSRIEMGVPFAAFMRNKTTLQPMLSLGKSVAVQFTLETSSEFGVPKQWCSDASTSFAYVFEGPSGPSAGAIAGVAVGLFLAGCLVTALAAIIWIRVCSKKAGYKQMP